MDYGRVRTSIDTEFEAGGLRGKGRIQNMSEGGLFVGTDLLPEEGENVDLSFRAPGGAELNLSGLVWWTTNHAGTRHRTRGFGLRLLDDSDAFRSLLESL
jgi:uncharacterized protein (TIGR02266 family)